MFDNARTKTATGAGRLTEVTPLDFLEAVHCNPNLPLTTMMRAAIEAARS
jgi:hypothetical protein